MDNLERLAGRLAHTCNRLAENQAEVGEQLLETADLLAEVTYALHRPRSASSPSACTLDGEGESATILVAGSEAVDRQSLCALLAKLGYAVLEAESGQEALLLAESFAGSIRLLISDVLLDDMSGRELAERLSLRRPDLAALYLSGYADEAILRDGVLGSAAVTLPKPVHAGLLIRAMREVLEPQFA